MAPPGIRERRVALRFRTPVVRQATPVKNRIASTLREYGVECRKEKLHRKVYFRDLTDWARRRIHRIRHRFVSGVLSRAAPAVLCWRRRDDE